MREIKFRAWDKRHFIMYGEVTDIKFNPKLELMQYTGLQDKKGREIYEGDIVRGWSGTLYRIQYELCLARYNGCDEKAWQQGFYDAYVDLSDIGQVGAEGRFNNVEIIGNIWEHSHLLEEER